MIFSLLLAKLVILVNGAFRKCQLEGPEGQAVRVADDEGLKIDLSVFKYGPIPVSFAFIFVIF